MTARRAILPQARRAEPSPGHPLMLLGPMGLASVGAVAGAGGVAAERDMPKVRLRLAMQQEIRGRKVPVTPWPASSPPMTETALKPTGLPMVPDGFRRTVRPMARRQRAVAGVVGAVAGADEAEAAPPRAARRALLPTPEATRPDPRRNPRPGRSPPPARGLLSPTGDAGEARGVGVGVVEARVGPGRGARISLASRLRPLQPGQRCPVQGRRGMHQVRAARRNTAEPVGGRRVARAACRGR